MVLDYIGIAFCTLANVSERRVEQLVNPDLSGLPPFLAPEAGLHSGFMIAQVTAAALASENKVLAHPASVDTVPTSANQEDHVSMACHAARRPGAMNHNLAHIIAIELLTGVQGIEFRAPIETSPALLKVMRAIRRRSKRLEQDRYLADDIEAIKNMVMQREVIAALEDDSLLPQLAIA